LITCKCGKEFEPKVNQKYCSENCKNKARRESKKKWRGNNSNYEKLYYNSNKINILEKQKKYHKLHRNDYKNYWIKNKDKKHILSKKSNQKLKQEVFTHYCNGQPHCQDEGCNVTNLIFLTIDHINNNGAEERRKANKNGTEFYRWIKQNEYLKGYQVLCWNHNKKNYINYQHNNRNIKYIIQYVKNDKRKLQVLSHYSNGTPICACCGETDIDMLSIDHVNNDGSKHRKQIGDNIYLYLKNNNFPQEGYRVLCMNCNAGRAHNGGICPHEEIGYQ
jgi:hypothetical protein